MQWLYWYCVQWWYWYDEGAVMVLVCRAMIVLVRMDSDDVGVSGIVDELMMPGSHYEYRAVGFDEIWRTGCCRDPKTPCS